MSVLRISIYHDCEVFHSLFVVINHLICFCTLMHVPDFLRKKFNTSTERKDSLLKLLHSAVCQPDQVINVCLKCQERLIFYRKFQGLNALLVLLTGVESLPKPIQNLRVTTIFC